MRRGERVKPIKLAGIAITTFGDSLFWTSTQLLTVSSQLPNPISTPARVLDVFLPAYAISAVAILGRGVGAELEACCAGEHHPQAGAHERVIVDQQDADHRGKRARTTNAPSASTPCSSSPPGRTPRARPTQQSTPSCRSCRFCLNAEAPLLLR